MKTQLKKPAKSLRQILLTIMRMFRICTVFAKLTDHSRNVFLGLALDKQNRDDEAKRAYQAAIKSKSNDALAWQGLISLYEKHANKDIDDYCSAALRLAEIHMAA